MALEPQEIGERIKEARLAKGWTQLDFAYAIDRSPSAVSRWERGGLPSIRELIRIARVLEIPPEQLVERADGDATADPEVLRGLVEQVEALRAEVGLVRQLVQALGEVPAQEPPASGRRR